MKLPFRKQAVLTEDATSFEDSVQLHYSRKGVMGRTNLFTGPPKEICPPVQKLKKGTKVVLTYNEDTGEVVRVELDESAVSSGQGK